GFDIGVEQRFLGGALVADVTYFDLQVDDLIDWAGGSYNQIEGTSTSRGVETTLSYRVNEQLSLGGSYTYTDAVDQTGARLVRVPRHSIGLLAAYQPTEKWLISATGKVALDTLDTGDFRLDDYFLLNAKVAYK